MNSPERFSADLFERVRDSMLAAAEIGANKLLGYDETALAGCAELQGACVAIDITDLDLQLYCHPGSWGIRLSANPPAREVDATISGRLMSLVSLASRDDKVSTAIQEQVSFRGNVALAQKLQKLIAGLDIDWEEALAERFGDVLAFQINNRARSFAGWLRQSADSLMMTTSEYLREEARLSPAEPEFEQFRSRVSELKNDVARAEQRLERLLEKLRPQ